MDQEFADALLRGPRGRRLCAAVLTNRSLELWEQLARAGFEPDDPGLLRQLTDTLDATEVVTTAHEGSFGAFLPALREAVRWASYWQAPDAEDRLLASSGVVGALLPVARALAAAPAAAWWSSPIDRGAQRYVAFLDGGDVVAPVLGRSAEAIGQWRRGLDDAQDRGDLRSADPRSAWSGEWWSAPTGLIVTSRALDGYGAAGLQLIEDEIEWDDACLQALRPREGARVLELAGPEDWTELVGRYPLEVTASRRHDWWRATGGEERWLLPDWARVAADWDGVHLSVTGYLATAGRRLPVGGGSETVLAGWNPDATHWLTDALEPVGEPERWLREGDGEDGDGAGWTPVPAERSEAAD